MLKYLQGLIKVKSILDGLTYYCFNFLAERNSNKIRRYNSIPRKSRRKRRGRKKRKMNLFTERKAFVREVHPLSHKSRSKKVINNTPSH